MQYYLYAYKLGTENQKFSMMSTTVGCHGEQVLSSLVWWWSNPRSLDILGRGQSSGLCPIGI